MRIRKRLLRKVLVPVAVLAATMLASTGAFAATSDVYQDSLSWENWSWDTTISTSATSPVQSGSRSMAVTYHQGWAGASFYSRGGAIGTSSDTHLKFSIHPNWKKLPKLAVAVYDGSGQRTRNVPIDSYTTSGSNGWYNVSVPVSQLNPKNGSISRVTIQESAGSAQPKINIDNVRFTGSGSTAMPSSGGGSDTTTSVSRPSGSYKPAAAPKWIDDVIRDAVAKYNLPRWFYYAIIHRETSFNPNAVGSGNDLGLTQLGSSVFYGETYPNWLSKPNNHHQQYGWDLNFRKYGMWNLMEDVTPLYDPFNAKQNIERFSTGYAVGAFKLFKKWYGENDERTLRRVAFHWNKGMYLNYDSSNWDYLGRYDQLVKEYKPKVEANDGKWNGSPRIP